MNNIVMLQPLTAFEAISLMVSIAGFAVVVLTLWFIQRQTRSGADSLKSSAHQTCADQLFTIDKVFVEYPGLQRYFYSGSYISEGDPAYERVVAISDLFLDFIDTILILEKKLPEFYDPRRWEPFFIDLFSRSPVLCKHLSSNKRWFPQEMIELMNKGEGAVQKK